MRFSGLIAVIMVTISLGLIGCNHGISQNYSLKNQWLANNYPDRTAHLNQISTVQLYFRDDVIAGQIQLGMTVDEVLIATDTAPFGPKHYKGKFWCNDKIVQRCDAQCVRCEGMVFLKDQLVWFYGHYQPPGHYQVPTVVEIAPQAGQVSIFNTAPPEMFRIADALYRDEIVIGMSFSDVIRILRSVPSEAMYYCDNEQAKIASICDTSCAVCKIEIPPDESHAIANSILLQPYLGDLKVTHIKH
jgi:hypothetical protein